jgi:hypothetical protein
MEFFLSYGRYVRAKEIYRAQFGGFDDELSPRHNGATRSQSLDAAVPG